MSDNDIEVVVRVDSALDMTDNEYSSYLETLDESMLKLKSGDEPTRFVMRRHIPLKHATRIEDSKLRVEHETGQVSVGLGFIIEEVRASLKEVKNPASVPLDKRISLKFTGDGLVDGNLMSSFHSAGIVHNLYQARQNVLKKMTGSVKNG
jgi:hypothetical protein